MSAIDSVQANQLRRPRSVYVQSVRIFKVHKMGLHADVQVHTPSGPSRKRRRQAKASRADKDGEREGGEEFATAEPGVQTGA